MPEKALGLRIVSPGPEAKGPDRKTASPTEYLALAAG
jgi:hypothetical protein